MAAQAMTAPANSVCAVVVAFFPDDHFESRLAVVLPQVQVLVIVDNTPEPADDRLRRLASQYGTHVRVIENRRNLGIATALNQGLAYALENGCQWIVTLDQDSQCYPDMVDTLLEVYAACTPAPAVVGSNYFDARNAREEVKGAAAAQWQARKTVITSGSLIDTRLAQGIGGFRDDYFIDQVDHEFCLRARRHGHRIVISVKPAMAHSVGNAGGVRLPLLGTLPNHRAVRKYYIARNTVVTVAGYWRDEPAWCARRLLRLILGLFLMATLEQQRVTKVRAFAAGIVDGFAKRMGPCQRSWLR
jgi:rhamnosyltransferase